MRRTLQCLALVAAVTCGVRGQASRPTEGLVPVPGGEVWYQIMGSGGRTPLLLLHGGPGSTSCGFSVLSDLAKDRPVVRYDQLGTGRSQRPADTSLWRTARFVEEVDAVRKGLGLDEIHLLGHSWGGALATEYLLTARPRGVRSVILSSPLISTPRWIADARQLRRTLPVPVRSTLEKCDAIETADDAACQAATEIFYERFVRGAASLPRVPACEGSTGNEAIYRQMWGAAEFTATGSLRDFDRSDRLGELRLPVLFLAGRHDEARPDTIADFQRRVRGAKMVVLEHSAHATYRTETARYVQVVRDFLNSVEAR